MKITELQIGDWVIDGDYPAQITGITCDGEIETTANEKTNIEMLEPIYITDDVLKDNGFKVFVEFKDVTYYKSEDGRVEMTSHEEMLNTFNEWSVHIDTEDRRSMGYVEVTYLHQLQHILGLCEINIDFKL